MEICSHRRQRQFAPPVPQSSALAIDGLYEHRKPEAYGTLTYHKTMDARTLVTFEQFEQFPDDGMKHELLKGEHVVVPPPKSRHTRIQQKIQDAFRPFVREHRLGEVHIEAGFRLTSDTWLQPDVSFVRSSQIQSSDPSGYYQGAPALAIEIVSDSNTAAQLDLKTELYFANGSSEVWVVYPKTRKVLVHRADGDIQTIATGELRSDLLPGWSVPVETLFEA
jgi:Uma2 family endonuclease